MIFAICSNSFISSEPDGETDLQAAGIIRTDFHSRQITAGAPELAYTTDHRRAALEYFIRALARWSSAIGQKVVVVKECKWILSLSKSSSTHP